MEVADRVEECQAHGTKRKREDVDLSMASTQYGVRLFSFLPPQGDQVTIKEEKQNPSQVYHWRYAQGDSHPRKKQKKEDKAAAIIKKVLKSHKPKDRNTNAKMKISNLLCGNDVTEEEKPSFKSIPLQASDNPKYQVVVTSEIHVQYAAPQPIEKLKPTSSILNQIHQKYSFPLESASQINFTPVTSFSHSALTANALGPLSSRDLFLQDLKSFKEENGLH